MVEIEGRRGSGARGVGVVGGDRGGRVLREVVCQVEDGRVAFGLALEKNQVGVVGGCWEVAARASV